MDELEKCSVILVDVGYAEFRGVGTEREQKNMRVFVGWKDPDLDDLIEDVVYTEDSLVGRRQADQIENWLHRNQPAMLIRCKNKIQSEPLSEYDGRKKRLDRIKWCIEHLIES